MLHQLQEIHMQHRLPQTHMLHQGTITLVIHMLLRLPLPLLEIHMLLRVIRVPHRQLRLQEQKQLP